MPRIAPLLATFSLMMLLPAGRPVVLAGPAQAPDCRPPVPAAARAPIMFTEEQENDLGDAINEHIGRSFRIIENDDVTGYLRQVGDRLVRHLPPSKLHFQFFLIDLPDANAMEMPGGRIYVSRKLIALTKDEDELAAVVAHEAGHLIARQQAARFSRLFKEVLGVTAVTDRADIFEKYNQLTDSVAKRPSAFRASEGGDQVEADQMGLYAAAAAGYDPQAEVRILDRTLGTKGDTGGFFSNLFGATNPDAARLREALKNTRAVPAACLDARSADPPAFDRWRSSVIAFTGLARKEALHGVVNRTVLDPPLRSEIESLRFSPDGRLLFAQDDGGITVLSRDPFQTLFHIDASAVAGAQFSPDSKSIIFHTSDHRVERWDLASRAMAEVHEVHLTHPCLQAALAPDGKMLACVEPAADFTRYTLTLLDVATVATVLQVKEFTSPSLSNVTMLRAFGPGFLVDAGYHFIEMGFSTDGRYFAAGHDRGGLVGTSSGEDVLVYDLQAGQALPIKGDAKKYMGTGFTFTGPDELVAVNRALPKESAVIKLPAGTVSSRLLLFDGDLQAATRGAFVFIRPFQKYAVGVLDAAKQLVVKGLPNSAIDVYDQVFVAERGTGELGLYSLDNHLVAAATLPRASLSRVRAAAVSADFKWLAVSERARGMLWDLAKGTSVTQTREFTGAAFSPADVLIADFPKAKGEPRQVMRVDPSQRVPPETIEVKDAISTQIGPYFIVRTPAKKDVPLAQGQIIEVRDVVTAATLWTKTFAPEPPEFWLSSRASGAMVLSWPMTSKTARDEVKRDAALSKLPAASRPLEADSFVQVLDMKTGDRRGQLIFDTGAGSFNLSNVVVEGDVVTIADNQNRVRLYSLKTGESYGRVFGNRALVSPTGRLFTVENGPGKLTVYDVATLQPRGTFVFSYGISLTRFSPDGAQLFVLTADQTAFVLDLAK